MTDHRSELARILSAQARGDVIQAFDLSMSALEHEGSETAAIPDELQPHSH